MEQWKNVNGYPDYAISSLGNVKSLRFSRFLKPSKSNNQYLYVNLMCNKIKKTIAVHKLVMEHFGITKPDNGYVIDHIDGNKSNNDMDNLQWVSVSENTTRYYGNQDKHKTVKELREKGWTIKKIADHIGMSLSFVHNTIHVSLANQDQ